MTRERAHAPPCTILPARPLNEEWKETEMGMAGMEIGNGNRKQKWEWE